MNSSHIDKIGLAMTSQSKHKTNDPHAENKRLFAIDCLHSDTPGIYWQCKIKIWNDSWGNFRAHETPNWFVNMDYRRDPEAPDWKKQDDIIDRLTEFMRPKTKYGHIKKGDRVIVGHQQERRYFSHEKDGIAYCFPMGTDEWSSKGQTSFLYKCELWDGKNG